MFPNPHLTPMASRIEDYALIGDCETAALVSRDGSVDWLCWPDFGSPACFAALLGSSDNGCWRIAPAHRTPRIARKYRDHTLMLETTFETQDGSVRMTDFMPMTGQNSSLIRVLRGLDGRVPMQMELILRFDYGRTVPWVSRRKDGTLQAIAGPDMVVLRTAVPHRGEDLKTVSEFVVGKGDEISFALTYERSYKPLPPAVDPAHASRATARFWTNWTSRSRVGGKYGVAVERSLITLKALTFRHTGGMVSAPTTSLPERLGSSRNWDYRFCWLRDATFTLLALMHAGYSEEARTWRDWLLRAVAGSPDQVQIMYGIRGERQLTELELPWLPGYENSKPVRMGNAASGQLQLDVYGEVADALFHAHLGGIALRNVDFELLRTLVDHLAAIWEQPDEGIWEVRGARQQFTYSKVMAWVAFDRAIKSVECFGMKAPLEKWRGIRDGIHREVCKKAYNSKLGCFVQAYGSAELDAALLLMPLVGFLPGTDPRIRGTIEAIQKRLTVDGLVLRYDTERINDGLASGEGAFLACSFWMVSALKLTGRTQDARALFDRLLGLRNDVGLLAEEYDARAGRQVGNFPQALSHISLVNAAFEFMRAGSPGKQRSQSSTIRPAGRRTGRATGNLRCSSHRMPRRCRECH